MQLQLRINIKLLIKPETWGNISDDKQRNPPEERKTKKSG